MVNGRIIYITLNGTKIAALKSCKLSTDCETIEVASATSSQFKEFIAGRKSWSMTCSWLVQTTAAMKAHALRVGTTYTITFTDGTTSLSGSAICKSCDVDAVVGNLTNGSFKFQGSGALT